MTIGAEALRLSLRREPPITRGTRKELANVRYVRTADAT
jgi:hypothetical protein